MTIDDDFLNERIEAIKAEILLLDIAIRKLIPKLQQQYSQDSGQTRIMSIRVKVKELKDIRRDLIIELNGYCNQLNGTGSFTMAPGY